MASMLISALKPLSTSEGSVPVAIFSVGDQQKILGISENYEVSWESFFSDNICHYVLIFVIPEIPHSGYSKFRTRRRRRFLWTFLDTVDVSIVERAPG